MAAHARLSPSSSSRWLPCPGSVVQCMGIADEASVWSAEGVCAHWVSDMCLSFGFDPEDFVGTELEADGFHFEVTPDWPRYMDPGIERIRDFGGAFFGERKVKLDRWMPGQFGTLDRGVVTKDLVVIGDFKWGEGVPVSPIRNTQIMIYALGFWEEVARHLTDATDFLIIVDQPRADGGGGEWRTTLDELLEFGRWVKKVAAHTYEPGAPLVPGLEQCKFCPAAKAARCPAFDKFNMDLMGLTLKDLDAAVLLGEGPLMPKPTKLTPERRCHIVKHAPLMRKWLESLHGDVLGDALAGRPTPGLKAVVGRSGPRQWKNEKKVEGLLEDILGDNRFTKKLKSPTEVEKAVSEREYRRLRKFIHQSDGKPSLVADDDKRARIEEIGFSDLDD